MEILLEILLRVLLGILSDLIFCAGGGLWVCMCCGKEKFDLMTGGGGGGDNNKIDH